jgi:hypothetical protein
MNPCYQKASGLKVSNIEKKAAGLDYNQVHMIVNYSRCYMEEMRYEPVWNLENGALQNVGKPQVKAICAQKSACTICSIAGKIKQ